MSKFNSYAVQLDELAHRTFERISEAETAYQTAQDDYKSLTPSSTPEAQARAARMKARLIEAENALQAINKNLPDEVARETAAIRAELTASVNAEFVVDSEKVDTAALALLQSGIMRGADFAAMYARAAEAGNNTMCRLIAAHADKLAKSIEEKNGHRDPEGEQLRQIVYTAKALDGRAYLESFDGLSDTLRRSVNNHSMIKFWDQLTSEAITNF